MQPSDPSLSPSSWLKVEFHCHTIYSKDSLTTPERLLAACQWKSLDRLVVTDHNTIAGARRAQALDPQRVIVGEEIMTREGEILAVYVQEEVPPGLPAREVIDRLQLQGAFISLSHPRDRLREGHWRLEDLLSILPLVDAIETFNARCLLPGFNREAQAIAHRHGLAGTVGSDAHSIAELGAATLTLPPFADSASLKAALPLAQPALRLLPPWVHLASRYAVWVKKFRRSRGQPIPSN